MIRVFSEKLAQLSRKGNIWLEPMSEFFKAAHQAHELSESENLAAKQKFLKKIGSNFRLSERTLRFSYAFPWRIIQKSAPMNKMLGD